MEISDWFPLVAALFALGGVWWSIKRADDREHRQWRKDQSVHFGAELLQQSVRCREILVENVPEIARYASPVPSPGLGPHGAPRRRPPRELRQGIWIEHERLKKLVATFSFVANEESTGVARSLLANHSNAYAMTSIMFQHLSGDDEGMASTPQETADQTISGVRTMLKVIERNENLLVTKIRSALELPSLPSGYSYSLPPENELHEF